MAPHDRLTVFLACAIRVLGIGSAALLIACQTVRTTDPGAIGVEREQKMSPLVSEGELRQGGKIAIYSGFIERIKPTDAELAAVIGHEVAHALREHARERASQAITQGLLLEVIGQVAGVRAGSIDFTQLALQVTLNLPSSREHEDEADRIGVELAARAGYDPRAAVTLWQKMTAMGGKGGPEFLSTHPSGESRQRDVSAYADKMLPLYEAARKK